MNFASFIARPKTTLLAVASAALLLAALAGVTPAYAGDYGPSSDTISVSVSGKPAIAQTYTQEELSDLEVLDDEVHGYLYRKPSGDWNVVAGTDMVTLENLVEITDGAKAYWGPGASLQFECTDGPYDKYSPTWEEVQASKLFFGKTTLRQPLAADATPTPCGVAFKYLQKQIAADETAQQTIDGASADEWETSTRFCIGLDEDALMVTGGDANMGKRMPTNVTEITIVPAE